MSQSFFAWDSLTGGPWAPRAPLGPVTPVGPCEGKKMTMRSGGPERVVSMCWNLSRGPLGTGLSEHSFLTLAPHTKAIASRPACITTGRFWGQTDSERLLQRQSHSLASWETCALSAAPGGQTACLGCLRSVDTDYTQCWGPNA